MTEQRAGYPMQIGAIYGDEDAQRIERITGKPMHYWLGRFKERLVSDVQLGRLDPRGHYPMTKVVGMCSVYGFGADDLIYQRVETEKVMRDNLGYVPPTGYFKGFQQPVATVVAARLNPEKYAELETLYGKVKSI